jgi:serine/threonine protein kinase
VCSLCRVVRLLEPKLQRSIATSVARGMAHLHSRSPPILHLVGFACRGTGAAQVYHFGPIHNRFTPELPEPCFPHAQDLKSPNILIDNQWRIKIGDFGLSRLLKGGKKFVTANVESGTPEWMAPEVLRTEGGSDKSDVSCCASDVSVQKRNLTIPMHSVRRLAEDGIYVCCRHLQVYSYGVVLWEILTGEAPWDCMHPMQVVGAVGFQQKQLPWPEEIGSEAFLVDLAKRCMSCKACERPGFAQVCCIEAGALYAIRMQHVAYIILS